MHTVLLPQIKVVTVVILQAGSQLLQPVNAAAAKIISAVHMLVLVHIDTTNYS